MAVTIIIAIAIEIVLIMVIVGAFIVVVLSQKRPRLSPCSFSAADEDTISITSTHLKIAENLEPMTIVLDFRL